MLSMAKQKELLGYKLEAAMQHVRDITTATIR